MQFLGPELKAKKAPGSLLALEMPSANLPGLNSPASSPQMAGSRWMNMSCSASITFGGYVTPPSSIFLYVRRLMSITGGYRRRTSLNTIITCHTQLAEKCQNQKQ